MAISELTITNSDTQGRKIQDIQGDTLVGTPAENKAKFDDYSELIKDRFNSLVDALTDYLKSSGVGGGALSDTIRVILESGVDYYVPKLDANNKIKADYLPVFDGTTIGAVPTTDLTKHALYGDGTYKQTVIRDSNGASIQTSSDTETDKYNIRLQNATNNVNGLMGSSDKTKLDGLNKTTSVTSGGTGIPTSGAVYSAIQSVAGIASDTADFVVSYEEDVEAADMLDGLVPEWTVRKWNSGLCEIWAKFKTEWTDKAVNAKKAVGSMYVLNMGEDDSVDSINSFEGVYYPENLFVETPMIERLNIISCDAGARLSYLCPARTQNTATNKAKTHAYHLVCPRATNATMNIVIGAYIVGRWK